MSRLQTANTGVVSQSNSALRINASACLALMLAALCLPAGCATVSEEAMRGKYGDTSDSIYGRAGGTNETVRLDGNSGLDDYLRYAFAHSPTMRAAFERWSAAIDRMPQARSLEDPSLSFEYFIEQRDLRYQVSLTQAFPGFGKIGVRDKVAASEAEAAAHDFEAKRFTIYDAVVKAFYEYHYLYRATVIAEENLQLLSDLEQVVTTRYKTGAAPFSELIRAQVEKDRLANDLASMRDERGAKSAILAALLNLPARDVLPWPKVAPAASLAIDETVLEGMIEDLNPELKAANAMMDAGRYREELARKSFVPDFVLGASWMIMAGADGRGDMSDESLMAGLSIPLWWGRYRAEIREAGAVARAVAGERDDRLNMLKAELSMAVFKFRDAGRKLALLKDSMMPKATQSLEVTRQEFASGKTDFTALVDAQRVLLEFRLSAERASVDREIANAEIGCCIGKFAGSLGMAEKGPVEEK